MSAGLVVFGRRVPVAGVEVVTWLDDPHRAPHVAQGSVRADRPTAIVVHTSRGRRGGIVEARVSDKADKLARYQARASTHVSWHITIGAAGEVLQQCDAGSWMAWQASHANRFTVGIEVAQDASTPDITRAQVRSLAAVVAALCDALAIPRRLPVAGAGVPLAVPVRAWQPRKQGGEQHPFAGVVGHRNLTTSRGPGDPGDPLMLALLAAGFSGVDPSVMTLDATPVTEEHGDDTEHDSDAPAWPPLPRWIDPALEIDAGDDLDDDPASFVRSALPHLAALGVPAARAVESIAHCATECGWGRRGIGHNLGGVKLKERDNVEVLAKTGRGLAWWRAAGHVSAGDDAVVYYRAFDDARAFWAWWLKRYVPRAGTAGDRYAETGRRFWGEGDWFAAMVLAGYRGTVRQLELEALVRAGRDLAEHPSVAEHRRVVDRVAALVRAS